MFIDHRVRGRPFRSENRIEWDEAKDAPFLNSWNFLLFNEGIIWYKIGATF